MHKRLAPRSIGMDPGASVAMYGWLLKQNPVLSKKMQTILICRAELILN